MFGKKGSHNYQKNVDKIVDQETLKESADQLIELIYNELKYFDD